MLLSMHGIGIARCEPGSFLVVRVGTHTTHPPASPWAWDATLRSAQLSLPSLFYSAGYPVQ